MLSLPYVIKEAGYVLGVAMIIFGSFVALVSLQYLYEGNIDLFISSS